MDDDNMNPSLDELGEDDDELAEKADEEETGDFGDETESAE